MTRLALLVVVSLAVVGCGDDASPPEATPVVPAPSSAPVAASSTIPLDGGNPATEGTSVVVPVGGTSLGLRLARADEVVDGMPVAVDTPSPWVDIVTLAVTGPEDAGDGFDRYVFVAGAAAPGTADLGSVSIEASGTAGEFYTSFYDRFLGLDLAPVVAADGGMIFADGSVVQSKPPTGAHAGAEFIVGNVAMAADESGALQLWVVPEFGEPVSMIVATLSFGFSRDDATAWYDVDPAEVAAALR